MSIWQSSGNRSRRTVSNVIGGQVSTAVVVIIVASIKRLGLRLCVARRLRLSQTVARSATPHPFRRTAESRHGPHRVRVASVRPRGDDPGVRDDRGRRLPRASSSVDAPTHHVGPADTGRPTRHVGPAEDDRGWLSSALPQHGASVSRRRLVHHHRRRSGWNFVSNKWVDLEGLVRGKGRVHWGRGRRKNEFFA